MRIQTEVTEVEKQRRKREIPGVESLLKEITGPDGTINLSNLKKFGGGGTHAIYRSDKYPELLLKVMHRSVGKSSTELSQDLQKLDKQCSALYEAFDESRCIIEQRSIQSIESSNTPGPAQQAIVSVVAFDPCFQSGEKFGFNVESEESNESLISSKRYLYERANRSLLGNIDKPDPYVIKNYPLLNKNFENIFKLLDTEPGLSVVMQEFLTKYKSYYKKEGILLDINSDNVLFYKNAEGWQFKIGSVIKHDTGALTKKMLNEIIENPTIVNESLEAHSSIYYMPACIRALNACAKKVGIDKIIDDIIIDDKTIDALARIHLQMGMGQRAAGCAKEGKFSAALELYLQYKPDEKSDDTEVRDIMGTSYWNFIEKGGKETSRREVEGYLNILLDERNKFPAFRQKIVEEAVEGLAKKLVLIDCINAPKEHKETALELIKRYRDTLDGTRHSELAPTAAVEDDTAAAGHKAPSPFKITPKPSGET